MDSKKKTLAAIGKDNWVTIFTMKFLQEIFKKVIFFELLTK